MAIAGLILFCLTTAGFWKRIGGDWNRCYTWNDSNGDPISGVDGNLLENPKKGRRRSGFHCVEATGLICISFGLEFTRD